jgi:uncharacterized protein
MARRPEPKSTALPVLASPDAAWFEAGLRFECTQCGNCCSGPPGYVWLSDEEIDKFAAHLKLERMEFLKTYCRKIGGKVSLKERKNERGQYDCIFLKESTINGKRKRGCSVYEVRPLQCRTWPFWHGLLEDPDAWNTAAVGCPGMNAGKHYSLEQILTLRDATEWPGQTQTPTSTDASRKR